MWLESPSMSEGLTSRCSDFSPSPVAFPAFRQWLRDRAFPSYSGGSVPDSHRLPTMIAHHPAKGLFSA